MVRAERIELPLPIYKKDVLPLKDTRLVGSVRIELHFFGVGEACIPAQPGT